VAIVDTLGIADELARDGVFSREQAERLARVSGRAVTETLVTKADLETAAAAIKSEFALLRKDVEAHTALLRSELEARTDLLRNEFEARLQAMAKELIKWFAGIMLAHGIAVIGVTVTLVKLL
jgi:hypothetical protein